MQQLKEIEQSFGALLKQLPNKAEMDALLTDINQAGLGRGLQFELFKPAAQERLADFYAELPIAVKITGNYHDMGAFASDVAQLPRIVTLNDVAIANDKGVLTLDAVAKTFRYLDEEELAKQRKAVKDAKEKAQEMKRWAGPCVGRVRRCSRDAVAKATRISARGWPTRARARAGASTRCRRSSPTSRSPTTRSTSRTPSSRARSSPPRVGSKLAPDLTRRREPLEAYPLESLNMVGTLAKGKSTYALVRTPDKDVYQVSAGNYLGQNFGVILGITESEIRMKELVQDGSGDWTERTGTLQLIQADTKTQERKK